MRPRADMPAAHGELTAVPPVSEWADLARTNARAADSWEFEVAGAPVSDVRSEARKTLLAVAANVTAAMGLDAPPVPDDPGPIVVTGHQPDLYHAGVWVKDFLVQHIAHQTGGTGVDIVVDTDGFDRLGVDVPCLDLAEKRCRHDLAVGSGASCFGCAPVPSADQIEAFCQETAAAIRTLPTPAVAGHFSDFCDALREARPFSRSLSDLITGARRRFEGELTDYLELPVTDAAATRPYLRFALDILLDAERFARCHNAVLDEFRSRNRVRTPAQPFPNLSVSHGSVEVPFWLVSAEGRFAARIAEAGDGIDLLGPEGPVLHLPSDTEVALTVLADSGLTLAPRAVTLTLFFRTFLADLFIHGLGGDRYDRVTDGIARAWWGIELPPYVVASLTMYLPLEAPIVSDEDIADLDRRVHRLTHNPDEALAEMSFDSADEQRHALALVEEKRRLVQEISVDGADRKALGTRIRAVNDEMGILVAPLVAEVRARRDALVAQQRDSEVLTDRTYPFCLWSPAQIADEIR
ncbi:MAG: hypothetical protein K0B85_02190 [Coriobacteriia bacterium]|nr:hypothetical protein [Coriobacteriia bacterium]